MLIIGYPWKKEGGKTKPTWKYRILANVRKSDMTEGDWMDRKKERKVVPFG
jgi:hypothetical protein